MLFMLDAPRIMDFLFKQESRKRPTTSPYHTISHPDDDNDGRGNELLEGLPASSGEVNEANQPGTFMAYI